MKLRIFSYAYWLFGYSLFRHDHSSLLSLLTKIKCSMGLPRCSVVKNPPASAGDERDAGSIPGSGRFPWRRKWQPIPVFLPGESHGQRSLAGCSPWGCQESNTTEQLHTHSSLLTIFIKVWSFFLIGVWELFIHSG